jgi:AraC-like DNA-binding protein/mannose-6-phosphate isomerase-like protein (cupin superfamily)
MSEGRTIQTLSEESYFKNSECPLNVEILSVVKPCPIHFHNFYELVFILSGSAKHMIDESLFESSYGDVYLIPKNRYHGFTNCKNFKVVNLRFTKAAWTELKSQVRLQPGFRALFELEPARRVSDEFRSKLSLNEDDLQHLEKILQELRKEIDENNEYQYAKIIFYHICIFLSRRYQIMDTTEAKYLDSMERILNFIDLNYRNKISINELISVGYMSESTLLRTFKEIMGKTPVQYINELRISHACGMLEGSRSSILDIALENGFESSEYFSRKFKENTGLTPIEYRKLHG